MSKFKVGDAVGVGCLGDSCHHCAPCDQGLEQYCENGFIGIYNGPEQGTGANTYGDYSSHIVVRESFGLRVSHELKHLAAVAPLLRAGITAYWPLHHWQIGPAHKVGIVGLGGLGHLGVKIAAALGAQVVLFTTSDNKREDALRMGAKEVVRSNSETDMATHAGSPDFILNTVAAPHNLDAFFQLLKLDGTMTLVGAPASPHPSPCVFNRIMKRRRLAGSLIGGIRETQDMLGFCAQHGIVSDIESIRMDEIESAYERMLKSDVKCRFVMDMETLTAKA